jgi:hypothetical protein
MAELVNGLITTMPLLAKSSRPKDHLASLGIPPEVPGFFPGRFTFIPWSHRVQKFFTKKRGGIAY